MHIAPIKFDCMDCNANLFCGSYNCYCNTMINSNEIVDVHRNTDGTYHVKTKTFGDLVRTNEFLWEDSKEEVLSNYSTGFFEALFLVYTARCFLERDLKNKFIRDTVKGSEN